MTTRFCSPHRSVRHRLGAPLRFALALAALAASAGAARAGTPDLGIFQIVAPHDLHIGVLHSTQVDAWNVEGSYAGAYTLELLLSADAAYDASDVVLKSVTTSQFSPQILFYQVAPSVAPGDYRFLARVLPVPGEVELANNVYVGGLVTVFDTDLELPDASPIVFQTEWQEPAEVEAVLDVANVGSAASLLVFTAQLLTPAPWLALDTGDSFAIEGETPSKVLLTADSTGLALGTYSTTVRLRNVSNPSDFQDLAVSLVVGNHRIVLGDRLRGQIAEPGDLDEVRFDTLAGTKVMLWGHTLAGDLKLVVTVFAPSGAVEQVLQYGKQGKPLKKQFHALESGEYRLAISGKGVTTGAYRVKTDRRNPKLARAREVLAENEASEGGTIDLPVLMYPLASLDFSVKPDAQFDGPVVIELLDPDLAAIDLSGSLNVGPTDEVAAEALVAPKLGQYLLRISGFGADPGAAAKALIFPVQPPKGTSKVYVP